MHSAWLCVARLFSCEPQRSKKNAEAYVAYGYLWPFRVQRFLAIDNHCTRTGNDICCIGRSVSPSPDPAVTTMVEICSWVPPQNLQVDQYNSPDVDLETLEENNIV